MSETLYSAPITSQGMKNAVMRARQLTELTWTPLVGTIPKVTKKDGKLDYTYFGKLSLLDGDQKLFKKLLLTA